jgi:acyl carrier protein
LENIGKITHLVHRAVDEVNEDLEAQHVDKLNTDPGTVLFGAGSTIDSMTLVSLIVAVEESIRRELGLSVTLANEKAMSMERSPFKTLGSLIDYAAVVVQEAQKE